MAPEEFVAAEAALLDAGRFRDWLDLFADDGRYWVPLLGAGQRDPWSHNSIAYEDRLLLQMRVDRLADPRAHSQHPPSACQHVLQRSLVERGPDDRSDGGEGGSAGSVVLRTPFIYIEARGDRQVLLAGSCRHELIPRAGGWAIRLKRVDLLNPSQPLPAIQLFI